VNVAGAIFNELHPEARPSPASGENPAITARVREWLGRFQSGDIDRSQLDPTMDAGLTPENVVAIQPQIGALGQPLRLVFTGSSPAPGNATVYVYDATFAAGRFRITMTLTGAGKISGYFITPAP
jgi:hypothetical protein